MRSKHDRLQACSPAAPSAGVLRVVDSTQGEQAYSPRAGGLARDQVGQVYRQG